MAIGFRNFVFVVYALFLNVCTWAVWDDFVLHSLADFSLSPTPIWAFILCFFDTVRKEVRQYSASSDDDGARDDSFQMSDGADAFDLGSVDDDDDENAGFGERDERDGANSDRDVYCLEPSDSDSGGLPSPSGDGNFRLVGHFHLRGADEDWDERDEIPCIIVESSEQGS